MELVCHGGHCCGIKHIFGLPYKPRQSVYGRGPLSDDVPVALSSSNGAGETYPGRLVFRDTLPTEPGWKRLDRLLAFIDKERPNGVVEMVLTSRPLKERSVYEGAYGRNNNYFLNENWKQALLKRGFVEVNRCLNVNSGNILHIYHRNSGALPAKKEKKNENVRKVARRDGQSVPQTLVSPFD